MAFVPEKYDAIIMDSDIDTRMRLRQATSSVTQFGKVSALSGCREALQKMQTGAEKCDVAFISSRFDTPEVTEFIKAAKETKTGQDSAYILVLTSKNQDSSTIANNVMIGVDGFLFEPYSVDQLLEITQLSARVKKERSVARERIALTLLVNDIINQVDLVCYLKSLGHEPGTSMKKLKELCAGLPNLSPDAFQIYTDVAITSFGMTPVPKRAFKTDNYKGASSRVKKRMEQKIIGEAETIAKQQAEAIKSGAKS